MRRSLPERSRPLAGRTTSQLKPFGSLRDQADRLSSRLSDRDLALLSSLDRHRFLTTNQLQRFHFSEHQTHGAASRICRRVLRRLLELGVIEHLERRVGGIRAGSASYVWRVGPVGDQLLRQQDPDRSRARRKEPSERHLLHCLAIGDAHLQLVDLARAERVELLNVQTEPECWRTFTDLGGTREILKPDLAAVTASGDFEDHWFIEVDRATESLPTLLNKSAQYEDYRRTGREQQTGGVFPLVVWLVPNERHAGRLQSAIARSPRLSDELFRVCTADSFTDVVTGSPA